ncbi:MAG: prepilin-type N-terminal cleavage/methylation domain-containing protein [Verrucomicrobiota bacterium]|jgi:prepilin-type N-terminal cleavage/methylation domain-containing protein
MRLQRPKAAFTIIELLAVIAIMALIAALAAPTLRNFRKGDSIATATRQMLDAVGRARQLAIGQHTTVYMVFVPTNFWQLDPTFISDVQNVLGNQGLNSVTNLIDKQLTGYTFLSLHSIADQPGTSTPQYLDSWQTLPDSSFIPTWKFSTDPLYTNYIVNPMNGQVFQVGGFRVEPFPFPTENSINLNLPYIAFDYLGRLVSETDASGNYHDAYIPLAQGGVLLARDPTNGTPFMSTVPTLAIESPPGNSTNSFNLIHIDWLTGRARLEHQVIR